MTRANAANGDACPEGPALSVEAALRYARGCARRSARALGRVRRRFSGAAARSRVVSSAASIGVTVATIGVIALTLQHLRFEHDLALSAAAREVDMRATLLAQRLDAALTAEPQASEAEVFRRVLEAHPDEWLAQSILIDRSGRLVVFGRTHAAPDSPLAV